GKIVYVDVDAPSFVRISLEYRNLDAKIGSGGAIWAIARDHEIVDIADSPGTMVRLKICRLAGMGGHAGIRGLRDVDRVGHKQHAPRQKPACIGPLFVHGKGGSPRLVETQPLRFPRVKLKTGSSILAHTCLFCVAIRMGNLKKKPP